MKTKFLEQLGAGIRATLAFTAITGVIYPLAVTGLSRLLFPREAEGSLLQKSGQVVGSKLIAQKIEDPAFFWPRPSGVDFATTPSGATNQSPASQGFVEAVEKRKKILGADAPADLLTTSGSGLDPHISPAGAAFQVGRIAKARGFATGQRAELLDLVRRHTEPKTFGILGQVRVNIVTLNQELAERYPTQR